MNLLFRWFYTTTVLRRVCSSQQVSFCFFCFFLLVYPAESMHPAGSKSTSLIILKKDRHPYPRLPIPQRRPVRQKYPPRLAEHLYLPPRIIPLIPHKSPPGLLRLRISNPLPRHHDRFLLRYKTRGSNKFARRHLSRKGPEGVHRPRLHGHRSQS